MVIDHEAADAFSGLDENTLAHITGRVYLFQVAVKNLTSLYESMQKVDRNRLLDLSPVLFGSYQDEQDEYPSLEDCIERSRQKAISDILFMVRPAIPATIADDRLVPIIERIINMTLTHTTIGLQ